MKKYKYTVVDNSLKVLGFEDSIMVFDLSTWSPEMINYYRVLLAHERDLEYAEAYLNQMFFNTDTSLIDGALINSAIQILVKCFSNPSNMGRRCLDSTRVFRKHAKSIGEQDLTALFLKFYDARNTVICHDQYNYKESVVGLVVNKNTGNAEEITNLTVRTGFLYKQNQENLLRLIRVSLSYVRSQMEELQSKLITKYNNEPVKPKLQEVVCENITISTAW